MSSAFFVNARAFRAFEELFTRHGRAYRVRCGVEPHYIVLVDTLHAAVDLPRSRFDRSGIEERVEEDISRFFKIAIKPEFKTDDDIFRLDGSFALNGQIIASDRFKQRYEQTGLTGLVFKATAGSG